MQLTTVLLVVIALVMVFSVYKRQHIMPKRERLWLTILRTLIFSTVALFLLNPFSVTVTPDQSQFRVECLFDASGSMENRDLAGGQSRRERLNQFMGSECFSTLKLNYRFLQSSTFSEKVFPLMTKIQPLSGLTAGGRSLNQVADQHGSLPLGAVLLFSDGNTNQGEKLTEAAKHLQNLKVPVTTICLGSSQPVLDLKIEAPEMRLKAKRGKSFSIPITVDNSFDSPQFVELLCWSQGVLVDKKELLVPENSSVVESFKLTPVNTGSKVYRFTISIPKLDYRPENNRCYAMVEVEKSPMTNVLILTSSPSLQHNFIRKIISKQKKTAVSQIVRLSKKIISCSGEAEGLKTIKKEFPLEAEFYNQFDLIITDPESTTVLADFLIQFMDKRGGGLVVLGNPNDLESKIQTLIPAKSWEFKQNKRLHTLKIDDTRVFPLNSSELLSSSVALQIPIYSSFSLFKDPLPFARTPLVIKSGAEPLMLALQYGSGRFVVMDFADHWRWHLKPVPSAHFTNFWSLLLSWLGSSTKDRINPLFDGMKMPLNNAFKLQLKARDLQYEEVSTAQVSLKITSSRGKIYDLDLSPDLNEPGLYQEQFIATDAGEHQVEVTTKFVDGEVVTTKASFLSLPTSKEYLAPEAKSEVLQDVARITGGDFYASCPTVLKPLKVAADLPQLSVKLFWFSYFPLPLFLLILLAGDIFIRRRLGLK